MPKRKTQACPRTPRAPLLAILAGLAACAGDAAPGADSPDRLSGPLRLSGAPVCEDCRIALSPIAELGHPEDPASARPDAAVAGCMVGATSDSVFLLSGVVGGGQILVYGPVGRATSSIGRRGEGPGEFGSDLRLAVANRDTTFVVDNSNGRLVKLDASGSYLDSFRNPIRVHSFARLTDGRFLLHGRPSRDPDQPLFHLLDGTGSVLSSFGRSDREAWDTDQWVVSAGQSADYWAASMWEYELFRGYGDSLASAVVRHVDWFPTGTVWSRDFVETEPPPPLVTHIHEAADSLLWIYIALADAQWTLGIPDPGSAEWLRDSFDTMIEVIDLADGRILANHRSDDYLGGICGTRLVYAVSPQPDGNVTVSVFEPHLRRDDSP